MTKLLPYLLIAVLIGGVVPVQAVVNSRLGRMLGSEFPQKVSATTISFAGGFLGTVLLLVVASLVVQKSPLPSIQTPLSEIAPLFFTGGLYGVVFVTGSIMLVPKIGVAPTVGAMLCGQMIMSVAFDQIGFLGTDRFAATPTRLAGLGLMLAGIVLVSQKQPIETAEQLAAEIGTEIGTEIGAEAQAEVETASEGAH